MPRHPPCALDNLTNTPANITKTQLQEQANCAGRKPHDTEKKMLASTVQFSTTTRTIPDHPASRASTRTMIATRETPPPTPDTHPPPTNTGERCRRRPVVLSGPNSVPPRTTKAREVRCFHIFSSNPTRLPEPDRSAPRPKPEDLEDELVLAGPSTRKRRPARTFAGQRPTHRAFGEAP